MNHRDESSSSDAAPLAAASERRPPLTRREREILGLLAEGMSGAQIADKLVLSPETVRTHVRNAMAKLGASTRSQAVALALQARDQPEQPRRPSARPGARAQPGPHGRRSRAMLDGLVSLYDVDGGAVYLADEDGLSLRRVVAAGGGAGDELARRGRARRGRARARGARAPRTGASGPRRRRRRRRRDRGADARRRSADRRHRPGAAASRPIGRSELLLLQAFAIASARSCSPAATLEPAPRPGDGALPRLVVGGDAGLARAGAQTSVSASAATRASSRGRCPSARRRRPRRARARAASARRRARPAGSPGGGRRAAGRGRTAAGSRSCRGR